MRACPFLFVQMEGYFMDQSEKANLFHRLHKGPKLLMIANAWDVVSARLYEDEGFAAIGTTSAGIAAVRGYPDQQRISAAEMIEAIEPMAAALNIPLSADMEAGYSDSPTEVGQCVTQIIAAGAVGINLEDGTGEDNNPLIATDLHCAKIRTAREAAERCGIDLFINARVDVLLVPERTHDISGVVERAEAYIDAGANGIFVPDMGTLKPAAMADMASRIKAPLNLIAGPATPPVSELETLGIARLSFGPRPMRVALQSLRDMAREWKSTGTYSKMLGPSLSYDEVNKLLL